MFLLNTWRTQRDRSRPQLAEVSHNRMYVLCFFLETEEEKVA